MNTQLIIVFDLDDTLYEEMSYVRSGFRAVASYLEAERSLITADECFDRMMQILQDNGRGKVFDLMLDEMGILTKQMASRCIQVYRTHSPSIRLHDDAAYILQALEGCKIHIVTDGNQRVQESKLRALELYNSATITRCWISRRYGVRNEKPSPYCFKRICELEDVKPEQVIYVADNPNKDFVGIKPLGFRTIRIMRGAFEKLELSEQFEAEHRVKSLKELPQLLASL